MAKIGTGYMIAVKIKNVNGWKMSDYDFTLDFYVYPNRRQTLREQDLVRIEMSNDSEFYAFVDSQKLGEGMLRCRAEIRDPQPRWEPVPDTYLHREVDRLTAEVLNPHRDDAQLPTLCGQPSRGHQAVHDHLRRAAHRPADAARAARHQVPKAAVPGRVSAHAGRVHQPRMDRAIRGGRSDIR